MKRFFHMIESDDPPAAVYVKALETIVTPLERYGYDVVDQTSTMLRFTRRWRPGWVWVPSILLLPLAGLVLLLVFERTATITVELTDREGGGTVLIAAGTGTGDVRRGFAELSV